MIRTLGVLKHERVLKTRQRQADGYGAVAVVDELSVGYLNIAEAFVIKQHAAEYYEGNADVFRFSVNVDRDGGGVRVVKTNGNLAAFTLKLGGGYCLTVERIAYGYLNGELGIAAALVVYVAALGVPDERASVGGERFAALDVFNVSKIADVRKGGAAVCVFEPVADDELFYGAAGIGDDVYSLCFAVYGVRIVRNGGGCNRGGGHFGRRSGFCIVTAAV